jgi:hypothetical protein
MNAQKHNRRQISKDQTSMDYDHIEFLISIMTPGDQSKIDFAENFIHRFLVPDAQDDDIISLEPIECRLLKYLLASVLWKHESGLKAN